MIRNAGKRVKGIEIYSINFTYVKFLYSVLTREWIASCHLAAVLAFSRMAGLNVNVDKYHNGTSAGYHRKFLDKSQYYSHIEYNSLIHSSTLSG